MLKCGFAFIPYPSAADTIDVIRKGEALGYESAWIPDQTFYSDPFVLLTACALRTERIVLGLGVTNPYSRHPVLTARAAATLDEIAGGRLILGFGAGNSPELLRPLGIEQTHAATRLREAVVVAKALLRGETVRHRSATLVAEDVRLLGAVRPDLPVYIAARSPATLRAAGAVADGVILGSFFTEPRLGPALGRVAEGARSTERDPADVHRLLWGGAFLTDEPGASIEAYKGEVAKVIGRSPLSGLTALGMSDERIAELKAAQAAEGVSGIARRVRQEEIETMSLYGDAARCRARLELVSSLGIERYVLLLRGSDPADHAGFLEHFASAVLRR